MDKLKNLTVFLLAAVLGAGFFSGIANAEMSISLFPTSFRTTLNHGQSFEGIITVVNPNDFSLGVQPEKENLGGGAEGSIQLIEKEDIPFGLSSWISFSNSDKFIIPPKGKKDFSFKINIPENAQPGGHYAAVLFKAISTEKSSEEKSGVGISGRVGSIVLVEVTGDVKKAGEIESVSIPKFITHGPLEISFKVNNTGNAHFNPEGKIIFSGMGQKSEIFWEPRIVFPGYDRTFKVKLDKKYLFGPVKATLMAKISGGPEFPTQSFTVWAFPLEETGIVILVAILLWFGIKILKKKFRIVRAE